MCIRDSALNIAETMEEMQIDPSGLKLESGLFGAEPWSDNMRRVIENKLKISAYDIYGLSEVMGPGVAYECPAKEGLHLGEDHFIAEIVDPSTGKVLPEGEWGELTITTITKRTLPVIRYRTGDITTLIRRPCPCGRTHLRMAKVSGRTDDMLIIRGVNIFPSQVESALLEIGETEPHYQLVVDREGSLDTMEIRVELTEQMFSDKIRGLEGLERMIRDKIISILGISVTVKLVEPKSIPRSEGKAQRTIDRRKIL